MPERKRSTRRQVGGRASRDVRAAELLAALGAFVPFELAPEWDNVGLLAGRPDWPARDALLAIDLTDAVAREALAGRCSAIVAYHPAIFKGTRRVTERATCSTTLLPDLLAARISIFSLHTALDLAEGGTNDVLLDALDCRERFPLDPIRRDAEILKLVAFVPPGEAAALRAALSAAGAGVIGDYRECSFELRGRGSFLGGSETNPSRGQRGRLEFVDESRLEMIVPAARVAAVVRALYAAHSYEEPAFDLYPVAELAKRGRVGMGRVGVLRRAMRGAAIVERIGRGVDLRLASVVGNLRRAFRSVTAAAGSFGIGALRDPDSLVLTGEMHHHEAIELASRGVAAVCLGHYASELPVLDRVLAELRRRVPGMSARLSRADRCPFAAVEEVRR